MNTNPTQATETKPTRAPKSYGYFTFFPWVHESNPFGQAGEWGWTRKFGKVWIIDFSHHNREVAVRRYNAKMALVKSLSKLAA